jgi:hypothetical protein
VSSSHELPASSGAFNTHQRMMLVPTFLLLLSLGLVGCGEPSSGRTAPQPTSLEPADAQVVVDEPTLPAEEAYEFTALAPNASELARQWRRFRLSGHPVEVDFDTHVVLLVGFGESGSCPYRYGGVEIDRAAGLVALMDRNQGARVCTQDYNARTIGLTIDRSLLPDGVFQVEPPNGGLVSVAARPVVEAPQEDPDVVSASISAVYVTLDPEPVNTDGELRVGVRNESNARVVTIPLARLDRWTGLGFEPADPPQVSGNGDPVSIEPGSERLLLTLSMGAYDLEPGWYRVTLDLDVETGDFGRLLIRRSVEIIPPQGR